jgi:hypothetical protein
MTSAARSKFSIAHAGSNLYDASGLTAAMRSAAASCCGRSCGIEQDLPLQVGGHAIHIDKVSVPTPAAAETGRGLPGRRPRRSVRGMGEPLLPVDAQWAEGCTGWRRSWVSSIRCVGSGKTPGRIRAFSELETRLLWLGLRRGLR